MKQFYSPRAIIFIALFLFTALKVVAQPAGATMSNAIDWGTLSYGTTLSDTKNNSPSNGYINNMGQPSDDIYYKFTLSGSAEVNLSHCVSTFDTYMHLLDVNGTVIDFKDDYGPFCSTLQASIKRQLDAGTYYVVSEGYSSNSGDITTSISLTSPIGATLSNPINIGTLSPGIPFSDTKNNSPANGYMNNIGQASDDIYYKFTLSSAAEVSLSHCSSSFDTYIHLLDMNGTVIEFKDDSGPICNPSLQASIKRQLAAGTYFVVSEGYSSNNGDITTSVSIPSGTQEINTDFSQQMAQIFSSLETSRVPYGLLQDIAIEQTTLSNYAGTVLADSNLVDDGEFHSIYATLATARISTNAPTFTSPLVIDSLSFLQREPGKIILTGLFYRYSKFKDDAVQSNEITVSNNKVYDKYVSGVWQNPYEIKTSFAVSPVATNYVGKSQQILLPASLWFSNDRTAIASMQVDAGDAQGYRTITYGQPLLVSYPDTGKKVLTYRLILNSGTSLYSHSQIHISSSPLEDLSDIQMIPVTATEAYNGQYAQGTMTIQYANRSLGLRNPLIVAEGFDTGKITAPESQFGDHSLKTFRDNASRSPELNSLLISNPQFDIVYIDWNDGTDNIKKNALLLKQIIREVNTLKAQAGSTEKNVVLGQSMGGLVARWALKDMETNGENHQTRLYISHDSPHQGANVPLAYQFMARHLRNLYIQTGVTAGAIELYQFFTSPFRILSLSERPASRQMLINYVNGSNQIDNSLHDRWQNELKAKGYPQGFPDSPMKIISISNGSQCASPQDLTAGGSLFSYNGKGNTRFLGDVAGMIGFPVIGAFLGQLPLVLGVLPGRNDIKFEIELNATNNGGGNRVYYNKISYKKTVLWLIPVTVNVTNKSVNAPSGILSYEAFSGGYYDVPVNLNNSSSQNWFYKYNITASNAKRFNFVPTPSALDIGNGSVVLTQADYQTKYLATSPPTAPKSTPFQNFYTGIEYIGKNESHMSFNPANGNWLAVEMNNNNGLTTDCTAMCVINSIAGPDMFCTSESYSGNDLPAGATVTWSSTGSTTFTGSNQANPVTVNNSNNESISLTASVNIPGCGAFTLQKQIVTGNPSYPSGEMMVQGEQYPEVGTYYEYTVPEYPGAISYSWHVGPDYYSPTIYQNGTNRVGVVFNASENHYIVVTVSTVCGDITLENQILEVYVTDNYFVTSAYSLSPNPASFELVISYDDKKIKSDKPIKDKSFEIKLYDNKGKVWAQKKNIVGETSVNIDTRDIPDNTYFLHIKDDKEIIKKQVIIKH